MHDRLLDVLRGLACVRTEDGDLVCPDACLLRPEGALGLAASQLIPPELLLLACGRRFVRDGGAKDAPLRLASLEVLGLSHWAAVLSYRGTLWPHGLAGEAAREGGAARFFHPLYAWLDAELQEAERPSQLLEQLWGLELFPAASPRHGLLRLADRPILGEPCAALPREWQAALCQAGALHALEPSVREGLEGGAARFVGLTSVAAAAQRRTVLLACARWHAARFGASGMRLVAPTVGLWESLACLRDAFLEGLAPPELHSVGGDPEREASAELPREASLAQWRELGLVLWLPSGRQVPGGGYVVARAGRLMAASYLGVGATAATPAATPPAAAAAVSKSGGDDGGPGCGGGGDDGFSDSAACAMVSPDYLGGRWGSPLLWEVFLQALGVAPLCPCSGGDAGDLARAAAPAETRAALGQYYYTIIIIIIIIIITITITIYYYYYYSLY